LKLNLRCYTMGCTLFFLCTGRELFGSGGPDGSDMGARTKTKRRAAAAQDAVVGRCSLTLSNQC
jgi:hypothetical protein